MALTPHLQHQGAAALLAGLLCLNLPCVAKDPQPRIAELVYGDNNLVPVISYDVALDYKADRLGKEDSTAAFQAALDDAKEHGGTVFAPAGRYLIRGNLVIPPGITLRGDWKEPSPENPRATGTVLLAMAGRGSTQGKPFINVAGGGGLRDIHILYPEQSTEDIQPYPVCVLLGTNSTATNLNLVNPYIGIETGAFSTVMNVSGAPLKTGVVMLKAGAVPRCNKIKLSPLYWSGSGLPGAPSIDRLAAALEKTKAYGIQLNRQDAGIFVDVSIDRYPTGVKFMPPHGWTYWHDLRITNAQVGIHFTGGSNHRAYMTASSVHAREYAVLMRMDQSEWKDEWKRYSKSKKPYGNNRDFAEFRLFGCRLRSEGTAVHLDGSFNQKVDFQECTFEKWGTGNEHYAIDAAEGLVDIYDSEFKQANRHVRFNGRRSTLVAKGNRFEGAPDFTIPKRAKTEIDHTPYQGSGSGVKPLQPVPAYMPAQTGAGSLFVATESPYRAPNDGKGDATAGIQMALDAAGKNKGGTVYLPQGRYRLTRPIKVPPGVELRGANDSMPRPDSVRTMLIADIPGDMGKPENPPLISLDSSPELGGSGIAGLALWYPHQDFRDIKPYPWTIRSLGPRCWAKRLYLGNCYNAIDFATHDNDRHLLSRINGSALNIGFFVGNSPTIGWIDNCHLRPQDWALGTGKNLPLEFPGENKPTTKDIFRGTKYSLIPNMRGAGAITVGSGANAQITGFFTNGSTRAFDFIDHDGTGGGNANILIGGSEAGWGSWVKAVGDKGITFANFSINPMTRLPYTPPEDIPEGNLPKGMVMRVDPGVPTDREISFIISKFYGRGDDVGIGFDVRGGRLSFKQMEQEHGYKEAAVKVNGGIFHERNIQIGTVSDEE